MPKACERPSPEGHQVLIVSTNAETLDGMNEYFSRTGIASSSRRALNPLAELSGSLRALVVFPDDFPAHEVSAYLSMVRTRRADLAIVVVTKEPPVYRAMKAIDGHPLNATVLPRPAFGWTILDAIRATLEVQSKD